MKTYTIKFTQSLDLSITDHIKVQADSQQQALEKFRQMYPLFMPTEVAEELPECH